MVYSLGNNAEQNTPPIAQSHAKGINFATLKQVWPARALAGQRSFRCEFAGYAEEENIYE